MSNYGFVYILTNSCMPDIYKVGCTERSPHARAEELSRGSGVPLPFEVLFYVEFADFQTVEHDLHKYLDAHRISPNREFFEGAIREAVAYLYHHPRRLSCSFPRRPGEREPTIANVLGSGGPAQLVNPFEPSDAEAMRFAAEAIQAAKHGQEREGAQGD